MHTHLLASADALSDRDLRENAPLDAARHQQSYVESRIRTIEATLARAVVVTDEKPAGEAVAIGSTVVLRNLSNDAETRYTLVRPGEVNAGQGRISYESPVGQALLQRRPVGDVPNAGQATDAVASAVGNRSNDGSQPAAPAVLVAEVELKVLHRAVAKGPEHA